MMLIQVIVKGHQSDHNNNKPNPTEAGYGKGRILTDPTPTPGFT